ncbi:MAG TPA: MotA/TolQ/ExbB proton channel family protein [Victivallales bacterium]|nr:MotA/TolQ/ExbB proton channel family protein [Victivallales bacterium]HPO89666.1 MotA/TolQ/ExbB proton channel family protein [Victivallales bacterium]HRR06661.1 MotA/TolQ/ExbB proton channel family protein [Victivallales bacterium]HRU01375.1 MotA/TolQ/ExbB proton channel family protein [Victivallales bacterium]
MKLLMIPAIYVSPYYPYQQSDTVGKAIVLILILFSIFTWTIMIDKGILLYRAKRNSLLFSWLFREKKFPLSLYRKSMEIKGPVARVYQAGADELLAFYGIPLEFAEQYGTQIPIKKLSTAQIETLRSTLDRAVADQIVRLEDKMGFLSTAVSVSPLLGLFGTVWGIMMAFCAMAIHGKAEINAMAPGISGALLTTVVGLVVAIPSLIGYNLLSNTIRQMIVTMDNFVEEFMAKVKLEQLGE